MMPALEVVTFDEGIPANAHELLDAIEQLDRLRRDPRTGCLLVIAREFVGAVDTYFAGEGRR